LIATALDRLLDLTVVPGFTSIGYRVRQRSWGKVDFVGTLADRISEAASAALTGAVLRDANLRGAVLRDADLSGADLTDANLSGATCSNRTTWPDSTKGHGNTCPPTK
jgi:hypothetical protein